MIEYAYIFAFGCFALAMLMNLWKVVTGTEITDRILALDTMFINSIALVVLFGVFLSSEIFFEASLIMAMLGFISTVAYARFLLRGNIIE
ncbi:Na(+) H(+) antiporter subunit F [Tritonibacter mobilis]|jgi:multicomponent K+:H+ antiporter subunit F|uniref:K+/H+ antiporter subunit F n=1 Tax=Tritonibacter TaxID=2083206 RepID=UPI0001B8A6AF|nr:MULTISPECIES: K+/H+ antiporter subunit F [Tritonibacter]EEW59327.1 probable K(+)/H(+) antiporter subunit F [Ruegeria sp. TrichCH4B]MBW3242801.1 K+/H+ antiporter subunit F [Epibacterium sp. DP7N7-1]MCZ4267687.1 K+/H+ antiporter subunit F [Rhodobacteraceae bacterium G21628-S1]NKX38706.1 K+/H+ antiporter subunit F [Rhodobacteraceae bacterium R_SAG5]PXW82110.1 multisubunit potassium/proton antiporter PhaF subunit [Ruegeria sp. P4]